MGRGGVDHLDRRVIDQRDRFAGRVVGQAENDQIGAVEQFRPGGRSRARICRPVVPASPSMNTLGANGPSMNQKWAPR
jgi:hypothetical protein